MTDHSGLLAFEKQMFTFCECGWIAVTTTSDAYQFEGIRCRCGLGVCRCCSWYHICHDEKSRDIPHAMHSTALRRMVVVSLEDMREDPDVINIRGFCTTCKTDVVLSETDENPWRIASLELSDTEYIDLLRGIRSHYDTRPDDGMREFRNVVSRCSACQTNVLVLNRYETNDHSCLKCGKLMCYAMTPYPHRCDRDQEEYFTSVKTRNMISVCGIHSLNSKVRDGPGLSYTDAAFVFGESTMDTLRRAYLEQVDLRFPFEVYEFEACQFYGCAMIGCRRPAVAISQVPPESETRERYRMDRAIESMQTCHNCKRTVDEYQAYRHRCDAANESTALMVDVLNTECTYDDLIRHNPYLAAHNQVVDGVILFWSTDTRLYERPLTRATSEKRSVREREGKEVLDLT